MESTQASSPVANDVLHSDHQSKLTPEEIAKALAHHKKHHSGEQQQTAPAAGNKKKAGQKAK